MEPILIGYFPGYPVQRPEWLKAPGVEQICSANRAHVPLPENWYHQRRHNSLRHFDSEEIAWAVLQDEILLSLERDDTLDPPWRVEILRLPCEEFDLYAYKVFPVRFLAGRQEDFQLPLLKAAPVPADYQKLGYDVTSWSGQSGFGCCPLYCNGDARNQPVNRYCLLEQLAQALDLARIYSDAKEKPNPHQCGQREPEPYCVVEVWRKDKPMAEPKRTGEPFEWPPDLLQRMVQSKLGHGGVYHQDRS